MNLRKVIAKRVRAAGVAADVHAALAVNSGTSGQRTVVASRQTATAGDDRPASEQTEARQ
jgi:hypothetical protein